MSENPELKSESEDLKVDETPLREPQIEQLAPSYRAVIWLRYEELKEKFDEYWDMHSDAIIQQTGVKARKGKARAIIERQYKLSRVYGEILQNIVFDNVDGDVMFMEGMDLFRYEPGSEDCHVVAVFYYVPELEMKGELDWAIPRPLMPPEEEEWGRRQKEVQTQYKTTAPEEGDEIKENHEILMDVTASIEGEPYAMGSFQGHWMELKVLHYEELKDALLGRKKGDLFELEFPARYDSSVEGKIVQAQVKVHDLRVISYPEIDDALAKDDGYEDMADFKQRFHDDYSKYVQNAEQSTVVDHILRQIMLKSTVPMFPQEWISKNVVRMVAEFIEQHGGDKRKAMASVNAPDEAAMSEMFKGNLYREYMQQLAGRAYCAMFEIEEPGSDEMFEHMLSKVQWTEQPAEEVAGS